MMRIFIFLATNVAIMAVISVVFSRLGLNGILDAQGIGLNLNAVLVMSAVIGISGSFISLRFFGFFQMIDIHFKNSLQH